jgi:hypothetical protein
MRKEGKTNGLVPLAQTALPIAKGLLGKNAFVEIDIIRNWSKIVGEQLAENSVPLELNFNADQKNNGVLKICVATGALAMEIEQKKIIILEKINTYFGYNAVAAIKVVQNQSVMTMTGMKKDEKQISESQKNMLNDMVEDLKSDDLKEALLRLGESILKQ